MFFSVELAISALMFVFLIVVVLFTKKKYDTIGSFIYRTSLMVNILALILEIFCIFLIKKSDFLILNQIFIRIYILFIIILLTMIGMYFYVKIFNIHSNRKDFFNEKPVILLFLIMCIIFFTTCFFKIEYKNSITNYLAIGGISLNIIYAIFSFIYLILLSLLIYKKNTLTLYKKFSIYMFIVLYFSFIFINIFVCKMNILTFVLSLSMIGFYFMLEDQDIKLVEESKELKKMAMQSDRSKSIFLSKMSHEIRTPMNSIMGFSEYILNNELDDNTIIEDVSSIHEASLTLLDIINNILDVSSIESGQEKIENIEYDFSDIMYQLMSCIYSKIDNKKVKFLINIDQNMPCNFIGDKIKIYKILSNILDNAVKYTSVGEIVLDVKYQQNDSSIILDFAITDTGIGIKQEDYNIIFEKYYEKDIDFNKVQGTGLGLVVVKNLVDMLKGTIKFESKHGIGTTFYINIEQKVNKNSNKKIGKLLKFKEYKTNNIEIDCSDYTLLLVDDNDMNLKLAEKLLKKHKFKVDSVKNGIECLEKVSNSNPYDFIFLDHMMPNMDGIETLKRLKKINKCEKTIIIIMTANAVTGIKSDYLNKGFDDYISKPINVRELNKLLKKYIRR